MKNYLTLRKEKAYNILRKGWGRMEDMTRLELMTLLLSLEALLEDGKAEKALEVIKKVLAEAERS